MLPADLKVKCLSAGLATAWLGCGSGDALAQNVSDYATPGSPEAVKKKVKFAKKKTSQKKATKKVSKVTENANLVRATTAIPDLNPAASTLEFEEELTLNTGLPTNLLFTNLFGLTDLTRGGEGNSSAVTMLFSPATVGSVVFGTTRWSDLFVSNQAAIATAIDTRDSVVLNDFLFESSSRTGVFSVIATDENVVVTDSLIGTLVAFDPQTGISFDNGLVSFDAQVIPEPGGLAVIAGIMLLVPARRR